MIDGFLWLLHDIDNTVLAAECYVSNIINRGCSTRKKWANQEFTNVNWILFPMNLSSDHWTLLVSYSMIFNIVDGLVYSVRYPTLSWVWWGVCAMKCFLNLHVNLKQSFQMFCRQNLITFSHLTHFQLFF